jgi:hypothetical protein
MAVRKSNANKTLKWLVKHEMADTTQKWLT